MRTQASAGGRRPGSRLAGAPTNTMSDKPARVAIAFDIDGVFKYGREWSADGFAALKSAADAGMQYVFVTNGGGGLNEATYGQHLKEKVVASAAGGASLLLAADIAVRCIPASAELKLGVITALLGAPFFLYLIFQLRKLEQ